MRFPESGMGYQRVDIRLADGRQLKGAIVLNCELLEVPDDFSVDGVLDIQLSGQ